jgi:hypothetical protein
MRCVPANLPAVRLGVEGVLGGGAALTLQRAYP